MVADRQSDSNSYVHCELCEHRCGVDRRHELGKCRASDVARVFRQRVECGEESFLNPCHLFYLSGCDLRCVFCINELNAFDPTRGHVLTADYFRTTLAAGRARGAKTLQWVGGEPTIHLPAILTAMRDAKVPPENLPPIVWKSDFHFTPQALDMLTGVVDVFIADFKFGNNACAHRIAGIQNYVEIITRNLLAARSRARLIVRHLLLPGHHDCCFVPITRWLSDHLPEVEVSVREGYSPRWRAAHFTELTLPLDRAAIAQSRATIGSTHLKVIQ